MADPTYHPGRALHDGPTEPPSQHIADCKKRGIVSDEGATYSSTSPALSGSSSGSNLTSRSASPQPLPSFHAPPADAALTKRLKRTVSSLSSHLVCALTHNLMVDPVLAADGHTYERAAILAWLASNTTSPLDPSCPLDAYRLMGNGTVKVLIEDHVASGDLDDELCAAYEQRKTALSREQAMRLYSCGRVEEAAHMGLPEAQGVMAKCCYFGLDGIAKDRVKSVEWAKKAAAGGDRLVLSMLGHAYDQGEGGLEKDWATALVWYEKAAEQGHATSMTNIGYLYWTGGFGVEKNVVTAARWYRRAALAGCAYG